MGPRFRVIGAGLLTLLAGCSGQAAATVPAPDGGAEPTQVPLVAPFPEVTRPPAAEAGGACELLDYQTIEESIGIRFEVAAASTHQKTRTCLLRPAAERLPDLIVSVSDTTATASIFADDIAPVGAKEIDKLGQAAYWVPIKPDPDTGYGAALEVSWITGEKKLINLRYTFAPGDDELSAVEVAPKMVALARVVHANRKT